MPRGSPSTAVRLGRRVEDRDKPGHDGFGGGQEAGRASITTNACAIGARR